MPFGISHLIRYKIVQTESRWLVWSSSYGRFSTGMHNVNTRVKLEAAPLGYLRLFGILDTPVYGWETLT